MVVVVVVVIMVVIVMAAPTRMASHSETNPTTSGRKLHGGE